MDGYSDLYNADQVRASSADIPSMDYKPRGHMGYYEDSLRAQQRGSPVNMRCNNSNPYIQDDIANSQRHNPIRTATIQARDAELSARGHCAEERAAEPKKAAAPSENKQTQGFAVGSSNSMSIDSNTLLYLFIFVMLVFMCLHFWRSTQKLEGMLKDNLRDIKELMLRGA